MRGEYSFVTPTEADALGQPRTCGEYTACSIATGCLDGSAPHMRGIRATDAHRARREGVSPAHAGNTSRMWRPRRPQRDQPRLCGEHAWCLAVHAAKCGSAPLARGIQLLETQPSVDRRVSPACAGNTAGRSSSARSGRGQPRLRGEYVDDESERRRFSGSAPLARGIPYRQDHAQQTGGVSPACAVSNGVIPPFINANASFFLRFALHLSCRERRPRRIRPRHGMRHRSGGWMPAFRHASAMQRSVSVRSCDAGTLRNPWANASRTAFAVHPCSTARMAIP